MYILIKIRHNILIQYHGIWIEVKKKSNQMLEFDIFRNSSQRNMGVMRGASLRDWAFKWHPDALLAKTGDFSSRNPPPPPLPVLLHTNKPQIEKSSPRVSSGSAALFISPEGLFMESQRTSSTGEIRSANPSQIQGQVILSKQHPY